MKGDDFTAVLDLLRSVPRPPGADGYLGASCGQMEALEILLGYSVPSSVRVWLGLCNGLIAGPGGLYGIGGDHDFLDIAFMLNMYPHWRDQKWLPIAGDGNGNHYVVDAGRVHIASDGVFFVDIAMGSMELTYIVASKVSLFLEFLLRRELGDCRWPFDRDFVLGRDPMLGSVVPSGLLPWL
jgi:hypothetical protein